MWGAHFGRACSTQQPSRAATNYTERDSSRVEAPNRDLPAAPSKDIVGDDEVKIVYVLNMLLVVV